MGWGWVRRWSAPRSRLPFGSGDYGADETGDPDPGDRGSFSPDGIIGASVVNERSAAHDHDGPDERSRCRPPRGATDTAENAGFSQIPASIVVASGRTNACPLSSRASHELSCAASRAGTPGLQIGRPQCSETVSGVPRHLVCRRPRCVRRTCHGRSSAVDQCGWAQHVCGRLGGDVYNSDRRADSRAGHPSRGTSRCRGTGRRRPTSSASSETPAPRSSTSRMPDQVGRMAAARKAEILCPENSRMHRFFDCGPVPVDPGSCQLVSQIGYAAGVPKC